MFATLLSLVALKSRVSVRDEEGSWLLSSGLVEASELLIKSLPSTWCKRSCNIVGCVDVGDLDSHARNYRRKLGYGRCSPTEVKVAGGTYILQGLPSQGQIVVSDDNYSLKVSGTVMLLAVGRTELLLSFGPNSMDTRIR
jgi:hypothetical protein